MFYFVVEAIYLASFSTFSMWSKKIHACFSREYPPPSTTQLSSAANLANEASSVVDIK